MPFPFPLPKTVQNHSDDISLRSNTTYITINLYIKKNKKTCMAIREVSEYYFFFYFLRLLAIHTSTMRQIVMIWNCQKLASINFTYTSYFYLIKYLQGYITDFALLKCCQAASKGQKPIACIKST